MSKTFSSPDDFLCFLEHLNFFHMDLSLDRMDLVLGRMGLRRPPFFTAQVVGTNGKGSTATCLAALFQAHGLKTGLYTSPHFFSPAERVQIDGQWTYIADWLDIAEKALALCNNLTYFELLTVVALGLFAREQVDVAVLEAGLGAKYDATTATAADLAVFTPIALDHTAILGRDIRAIAQEKSHAIRSSAPVTSAEQVPEALAVLEARARAFHAPFEIASPLRGDEVPGLAGVHQWSNAATALCAFRRAADVMHLATDEDLVRRALKNAFIPGRLQTVPPAPATAATPGRPQCLLDGAHNPHGMQTLVHALRDGAVPKPETVIFSCLADKDWRSALTLLVPALPGVPFLVPGLPGERAEDPCDIARHLRSLGVLHATPCATLDEAFEAVANDVSCVLVTGSLYLLGEFYALWPQALWPAQTS